ncbi:uncharacterized protein LOC143230372 [Tachypleus tridentatus]|uniref:uncharacterized protein LOC143230372 n=1 Tax=Tachypleus tridentatus TaxID=6853 RepID=UPI003FD5A4AF
MSESITSLGRMASFIMQEQEKLLKERKTSRIEKEIPKHKRNTHFTSSSHSRLTEKEIKKRLKGATRIIPPGKNSLSEIAIKAKQIHKNWMKARLHGDLVSAYPALLSTVTTAASSLSIPLCSLSSLSYQNAPIQANSHTTRKHKLSQTQSSMSINTLGLYKPSKPSCNTASSYTQSFFSCPHDGLLTPYVKTPLHYQTQTRAMLDKDIMYQNTQKRYISLADSSYHKLQTRTVSHENNSHQRLEKHLLPRKQNLCKQSQRKAMSAQNISYHKSKTRTKLHAYTLYQQSPDVSSAYLCPRTTYPENDKFLQLASDNCYAPSLLNSQEKYPPNKDVLKKQKTYSSSCSFPVPHDLQYSCMVLHQNMMPTGQEKIKASYNYFLPPLEQSCKQTPYNQLLRSDQFTVSDNLKQLPNTNIQNNFLIHVVK